MSLDQAYTSYQWYRNGSAISGATTASILIAYDGLYKAYVTSLDGSGFTPEVTASIGSTSPTPEATAIDVYPLSFTVGVERTPVIIFDVLIDNTVPDLGYINFIVYENEAAVISYPSDSPYITVESVADGYRFTISGYVFKRKATVKIHINTEI